MIPSAIVFYFYIIIDLCSGVTCSNPGEQCVDGMCQCGTVFSCEGLPSGSFCDSANSICKCSATAASCKITEDCVNGVCKQGTILVIHN